MGSMMLSDDDMAIAGKLIAGIFGIVYYVSKSCGLQLCRSKSELERI